MERLNIVEAQLHGISTDNLQALLLYVYHEFERRHDSLSDEESDVYYHLGEAVYSIKEEVRETVGRSPE